MLPLLLACTSETAPVVSPAATTTIHRGVNLNSAAKSAGYHHGLSDESLALLADNGFTQVRLLVFWEAIEPEEGAYDVAYLEQVTADVDALRALGLEVVLDLHQDVYGAGFGFTGFPRWTCDDALYAAFEPSTEGWFMNYLDPNVIACFDAFWASPELQRAWGAAAAEVVAAAGPERLAGLDVMNEPYWGSLSPEEHETEALPAFYGHVRDAVRPVAPDLRLWLAPSVAANLTGDSVLDPGAIDDNSGFAPHFYPTYAELATGFDGDFGDEADVLDNLADVAEASGVPLWVGEFGIFSSAGNEGDYVREVLHAVESRGGSTAWWSYDLGSNVLAADGTAGWLMPAFTDPWAHVVPGTFLEVGADGTARFELEGSGTAVFGAPGGSDECDVTGATVTEVRREGAFLHVALEGSGVATARCGG